VGDFINRLARVPLRIYLLPFPIGVIMTVFRSKNFWPFENFPFGEPSYEYPAWVNNLFAIAFKSTVVAFLISFGLMVYE
jgi:hypothetical protein